MDSYIKRHAEATVETPAKMFGAVLVAGPRQVGKTTMLQKITNGINYTTLDDMVVRANAQEQSGTFFGTILRLYLWMRFKKRLSCSRKSKC